MVEQNGVKVQMYSIQGIIRGVAQTTGQSAKGSWKRAGITIEKADGSNKMTIATFDEADIKIANEMNGKEVKAVFTKSPIKDGKQFNNLEKGGLIVVGQGEAPITKEEPLVENGKEVPVIMTEKDVLKDGFAQQQTGNYKSTYETPEERARKQVMIVRQHSQSLALDYIKLCLEAVDKGILTKDEFSKEDLNIDNILKISREKAETDVLRA